MITAIKKSKRQDKEQNQIKQQLVTNKTQYLSIFLKKLNEQFKIASD